MKTKDDATEPVAPPKAPPVDVAVDVAALKEWVRREIHLAANGVSEAERETMNP